MLGKLTVVGSGMDAIRHLTTEAKAEIHHANIVYYCVCDPAAELVIRELNPNSHDLFPLYSEKHPRYVTYRKMADIVVDAVSEGLNVCMVYYGHPGVCATSPHAAIQRVRELGGFAKMLPAISSHDALLAELGIDPGLIGCQIYEATNYLTRKRNYDINTPLILYQISAIGDLNYYDKGFPKICVHLLIERIKNVYGSNHSCVLFNSPNMPFSEATSINCTIGTINIDQVKMSHTLYVPPKGEPERDINLIDLIHNIRDDYYLNTGKPMIRDFEEYSDTSVEHPSSKIYNSST